MDYHDILLVFITAAVLDTILLIFALYILYKLIKQGHVEFYRMSIIFWLWWAFISRIVFFVVQQIFDGDHEFNDSNGYKSMNMRRRYMIWIPLMWFSVVGITLWFRWVEQYSTAVRVFSDNHTFSRHQMNTFHCVYLWYIAVYIIYLVVSMHFTIISDYFRIFMIFTYYMTSILMILAMLLFLQRLK